MGRSLNEVQQRLGHKDVKTTLILAIGLVVLVIFLFLRSVPATLIPSVAMPIAIIGRAPDWSPYALVELGAFAGLLIGLGMTMFLYVTGEADAGGISRGRQIAAKAQLGRSSHIVGSSAPKRRIRSLTTPYSVWKNHAKIRPAKASRFTQRVFEA